MEAVFTCDRLATLTVSTDGLPRRSAALRRNRTENIRNGLLGAPDAPFAFNRMVAGGGGYSRNHRAWCPEITRGSMIKLLAASSKIIHT